MRRDQDNLEFDSKIKKIDKKILRLILRQEENWI
jgi:hypothetical protein